MRILIGGLVLVLATSTIGCKKNDSQNGATVLAPSSVISKEQAEVNAALEVASAAAKKYNNNASQDNLTAADEKAVGSLYLNLLDKQKALAEANGQTELTLALTNHIKTGNELIQKKTKDAAHLVAQFLTDPASSEMVLAYEMGGMTVPGVLKDYLQTTIELAEAQAKANGNAAIAGEIRVALQSREAEKKAFNEYEGNKDNENKKAALLAAYFAALKDLVPIADAAAATAGQAVRSHIKEAQDLEHIHPRLAVQIIEAEINANINESYNTSKIEDVVFALPDYDKDRIEFKHRARDFLVSAKVISNHQKAIEQVLARK